jgi:hypothetical protein
LRRCDRLGAHIIQEPCQQPGGRIESMLLGPRVLTNAGLAEGLVDNGPDVIEHPGYIIMCDNSSGVP